MDLNIHPSWEKRFQKELQKSYFKTLISFVDEEYGRHTC